MGIPGGMRWIALVLVGAACGCGGGGTTPAPPRLPHGLGVDLAARASAVEASLASGDECGAAAEAAQLREVVASAVAAGQVPERLRAPLSSSVDALAGEITCVPAPAAKPGNGPKPDHGPKPRPPGKRPKHDHGPGHDHGDGGGD